MVERSAQGHFYGFVRGRDGELQYRGKGFSGRHAADAALWIHWSMEAPDETQRSCTTHSPCSLIGWDCEQGNPIWDRK